MLLSQVIELYKMAKLPQRYNKYFVDLFILCFRDSLIYWQYQIIINFTIVKYLLFLLHIFPTNPSMLINMQGV